MISTTVHEKQAVSIFNQKLTMSSREIAELTGKQHKHVLDDCRNMFDLLNIQSADFSADYKDSKGRTYQEYLLDQDLTMTLVMGYNIPLRHKVAKRWRELESKTQFSIPQSLPEALRLAADLADKNQQLTNKVDELAPKAEFHDKVIVSHGSVSLSQAAKILNTGRNRLCEFMRQNKWLRRNNEPYQEKIEQGLLDVKVASWIHPDNGIQQSVIALVTGKGLSKLAQII